jgi:hypothetical protein
MVAFIIRIELNRYNIVGIKSISLLIERFMSTFLSSCSGEIQLKHTGYSEDRSWQSQAADQSEVQNKRYK